MPCQELTRHSTAEISSGLVVGALPYLPRLFKTAGPGTQLEKHRFYTLTKFGRTNKSDQYSAMDDTHSDAPIQSKASRDWDSQTSVRKAPYATDGGITKTVDISTRSDSIA